MYCHQIPAQTSKTLRIEEVNRKAFTLRLELFNWLLIISVSVHHIVLKPPLSISTHDIYCLLFIYYL